MVPSEAMTRPLTKMTILELTRLVSAQDDRWADILTYAQSTRHPLAQQGIDFFTRTWRPLFGDYFENVVARYDPRARAPHGIVVALLDKMSEVVYPAARRVGLTDRSFVFPDITIEQSGASPVVAGYSWMYW